MRKISMKRKSKSDLNTTEDVDNSEENGQDSSPEDNYSKKKSSKKGKKSKKSTSNAESNGTEDTTAGSSNEDVDNNEENDEDSARESNQSKKKSSKKGKKGRKSNTVESESNGTENDDNDDEEQYEVETVLDQKTVKGVKQFLIRWKGYGADSDTWEPEETLSCPDLIEKFLNSQKGPSKGKKRTSHSSGKKSAKKSKADSDDEDDGEEKTEEYEVDRILEVHHKKNGKREFLVHWKGYTSKENTWEPEENMSCSDLIDRFMAKVDHAKDSNARELRVDRKPTKHFTLSMVQSGRRLSRRNLGKQRTQYKETD